MKELPARGVPHDEHAKVVDEFLADLAWAVETASRSRGVEVRYS